MSRKKLIFSVLLMAALVSVGIVLPSMHRSQTTRQPTKRKPTSSVEKPEVSSPINEVSSLSGIQYLGFEDLETFLSLIQIEDLKTQMVSYLQDTGYRNITSVTFLVDETSYPSNGETMFQFSLSDGSKLPVTCLTADGTFTFGEEERQISSSENAYTRIYTRQTDNSLPAVTTEEIEAMQEGGYADTENNDGNTVSDSTVSGVQTDGTINHSGNNTEEVTP